MGARLGDGVLDLAALAADGPLDEDPALFAQPSLNAFMAAGRATWARVREALHGARRAGPTPSRPRRRSTTSSCCCRSRSATTSTSTRRSSTRRTSGGCSGPTPSRCCPTGATCRSATTGARARWWSAARRSAARAGSACEAGADAPRLRPERAPGHRARARASSIGVPSALGEPVAVDRGARPRLRRRCWSTTGARATSRRWEYRPLGPFLGKSFATSVAAWVTPLDAISTAASPRRAQEPAPLPYLREEPWALDLDLEVELNGTVVARTNARHLYWSAAQQLAHLTVNGASLRVGDLFASGTISGPERGQRGLADRAVVERRRADRARRRVDAQLPGGRRRGRPARRAAATRSPSARCAGGSSRRADGAAQGHPAPGARPRCATTCACARCRRRRADPAAHDALRRRRGASCARRRPGAGASSSSASTRGRRPSCCARSSSPSAELHLVDPFGHHGWALPAGWGATERPAGASWPAPRAGTRARG